MATQPTTATPTAKAKEAEDENRLKTSMFRVSYCYMFKPQESDQGGVAKYSLVMLLDKADPQAQATYKALKALGVKAAKEKWGEDTKKWPKGLRLPWRDGDVEKADMVGYAGHWFVKASSKFKPGLIDQRCTDITEESNDFYAGCYARATVSAFAYDNVSKGISFNLHNVQKLRDGKPFGGGRKAQEDFEAVDIVPQDPETGEEDPFALGGGAGEEDFLQ